jgi:hypothetical protein
MSDTPSDYIQTNNLGHQIILQQYIQFLLLSLSVGHLCVLMAGCGLIEKQQQMLNILWSGDKKLIIEAWISLMKDLNKRRFDHVLRDI